MDNLVTRLLGLLLGALDKVFVMFSTTLIDLFALNNEGTLDLFFKSFPLARTGFDLIMAISYGVVFLIALFQIYKSLFPGLAEAEHPFAVALRSVVAVLLVSISPGITNMFFFVGTIPYRAFATMDAPPIPINMGDLIGDGVLANAAAIGGAALAANATLLITAVFVVALFNGYIKLVFEIAERYVLFAMLALAGPLAMATVTSKATQQTASYWVKLMISQTILMILGVFFLRIFHDGMSNLGANSDTFIGTFLILIAWLRTGTRVDQHMSKLGLSAVQAGGGLGLDLLMAARGGSKLAAGVANSAQKMGGGNTNYRGAMDLVKGDAQNVGRMLGGEQSGMKRKMNAASNAEGPVGRMEGLMNIKDRMMPGAQGEGTKLGAHQLNEMMADGGSFSGPLIDAAAADQIGGNAKITEGHINNGSLTGKAQFNGSDGIEKNVAFAMSEMEPSGDSAFRQVGAGDDAMFLTAQGAGAEDFLNDTHFDELTGDAAIGELASDGIAFEGVDENNAPAGFELEHDEQGSLVETQDGTFADISDSLDSSGNISADSQRYDADGVEDDQGNFIKSSNGALVALSDTGAEARFSATGAEEGGGSHVLSSSGEYMAAANGTINQEADGSVLVDTKHGQQSLGQTDYASSGSGPGVGDSVMSDNGKQVLLGENSFGDGNSLQRYEKQADGSFKETNSASAGFIKGADGNFASIKSSTTSDGNVSNFKTSGMVRVSDTSGTVSNGDASYTKLKDPVNPQRFSKDTSGNFQKDDRGNHVETIGRDGKSQMSMLHKSSLASDRPGGSGLNRFSMRVTGTPKMRINSADGNGVQSNYTETSSNNKRAFAKLSGGGENYGKIAPDGWTSQGKPALYSKSGDGYELNQKGGKYLKLDDGTFREHAGSKVSMYNKSHHIAGIKTDSGGNMLLDRSSKLSKNSDGTLNLTNDKGDKLLLVPKNTATMNSDLPKDSMATVKFKNGVSYSVVNRGEMSPIRNKKSGLIPFTDDVRKSFGNMPNFNMTGGYSNKPKELKEVRSAKELDNAMVWNTKGKTPVPATRKEVAAFKKSFQTDGDINLKDYKIGLTSGGQVITSSKATDKGRLIPDNVATSKFTHVDTTYSGQGYISFFGARNADNKASQTVVLDASRYSIQDGVAGIDYKYSRNNEGRKVIIVEGTSDQRHKFTPKVNNMRIVRYDDSHRGTYDKKKSGMKS